MKKILIKTVRYFKWVFRPKLIYLKVPKEYKTGKKRIECLKQTLQQILKHSKIVK